MADGQVAALVAEEREAVREALQHATRPEGREARRCELEAERQPFEPAREIDQERLALGIEHEAAGLCAGAEQGDRLVGGQRLERVALLGAQPQALA